MRILFVLGSLRSDSSSRRLAHAIQASLPEDAQSEMVDGRDLPLFDADLESQKKPSSVEALIDHVNQADALIFVTPEFNYGIPGPLKNWVDWASRPPFNSPLKAKPALVITQSISPSGGARAHAQLTAVLSATLTPTYLIPSFTIPSVHEKFDGEGQLTDALTQMRIDATLPGFLQWAAEEAKRATSG